MGYFKVFSCVITLFLSCEIMAQSLPTVGLGEDNVHESLNKSRGSLFIQKARKQMRNVRDEISDNEYTFGDFLETFEDEKSKKKFLARYPADKSTPLAKGQWQGDHYEMVIAQYKIEFSLDDLIRQEIKINGHTFSIIPNEPTHKLVDRIEKFLTDDVLAKQNREFQGRWASLFEHLIPSAFADVSPYKQILTINKAGVIKLSVEPLIYWRNDLEILEGLLEEVDQHLSNVKSDCEYLKDTVQIREESSLINSYGVLHDSTYSTLEELARGEDGEIRTVDVIEAALTKFAQPQVHFEDSPEDLSCEDYFYSWILRSETPDEMQSKITQTCREIYLVGICLNRLKSQHHRVDDSYRRGHRRYYDGLHFPGHDGESSLRRIDPRHNRRGQGR